MMDTSLLYTQDTGDMAKTDATLNSKLNIRLLL